jgi:predicted dehydrogenase
MGTHGRAASNLPSGHVEGFSDTHAAHFRAVYGDVVAGGPSRDPVYATFADGHEAMLVGDAIATSSRTGGWVGIAR